MAKTIDSLKSKSMALSFYTVAAKYTDADNATQDIT